MDDDINMTDVMDQNIVSMHDLETESDWDPTSNKTIDFEERLKRDKTMFGVVKFNLYRLWLLLNVFQYPVIVVLSLTTGTIAQLLFLETSDNITQGILYGWIVSLAMLFVLLLIYSGCWLCGSKKNKGLSKCSPHNIVWFLILCILLVIVLTSVKTIATDCFDENGNYKKPRMINKETEKFIIYCDINSFI